MANIVKLNYTAEEINERLGKVCDPVQTIGDSEALVMSQRAVTQNFALTTNFNLFDKNNITTNSLLNANNGGISNLDGYNITDFIPIEVGKTYSYMVAGGQGDAGLKLTVYDADKVRKGAITGTKCGENANGSIITVTIDRDDVKYARYNVGNKELDTAMFVEGSVYPDEFVPHDKKYLGSDIGLRECHAKQVTKVVADVVIERLDDTLESKADAEFVNLFDKNTITPDSLLYLNTNAITSMSGYNITDFIKVEVGKTYSLLVAGGQGVNNSRIAVYNSNKECIGYLLGELINNILTVTMDTSYVGNSITSKDIKYVRYNVGTSQLPTAMFVEGSVYPDEYYEYGKRYLGEDVNLRGCHIAQIPTVNSPLKGKKIAYNGDSICEERLNKDANSYNGGGYAKLIADLVGGTYENRAISGGVLASILPNGTTTRRHVCTDVPNMADDADLVCFEGGINDYWHDIPLGEFSESDYTGAIDDTTVTGALESIFRQAINKWVGKPICFVITHKITTTAFNANDAGYTFKQAHDRVIEVCKKYSIPYFDAFDNGGLNAYMSIHNQTYMTSNTNGTPDGCHPNEEGYRKYYVPQLIKLFESLI
jgi:lysophospholipase L1-like esterase